MSAPPPPWSEEPRAGTGPDGWPQYGQPPYDQSAYAQAPYEPPYEPPYQPPYGQAPYGQPPYGQPPYWPSPYGYPPPPADAYPQPGSGFNGFAVAGFVCAFFCAPIGLIFSIIGLNQTGSVRGARGRGLAVAGIVIASAVIVVGLGLQAWP